MSSARSAGPPDSPRGDGGFPGAGGSASPPESSLLERAYLESQVGLCVVDPELRFVFINEALARINGRPIDVHIGRTVREVIPEVADKVEAAYRQVLETGEALIDLEVHAQLPSSPDRELICLVSHRPLFAADGSIEGISTVVRDITQLKWAETLWASQSRILEQLARGADLEEIFTALIRSMEALVPGMLASILLMAEDGITLRHAAAPSLPEAYNQAVDGLQVGEAVGSCGTAAHRRERVVVADIQNDPLWEGHRELGREHGLAACWSQPILATDGRVLGTLAMYYREVKTPSPEELELIEAAANVAGIAIERRRADEDFRFTRFALDHSAEAAFWADSSGRFVYVNEEACRSLDYPRRELTSMRVPDIVPGMGEAGWLELWRRIREHGSVTFEGTHRRSSGEIFPIEIAINHLAYGGREYGCAFARDISERKKAEDERRRFDHKMQQVQKLESLGVLAGGIAHDFNNLLVGVMGNVDLALAKLPQGSDVRGYLENLETSAQRLADLAQQMLAYSGRGSFVVESTDLANLVREMTHLLDVSISKKALLRLHVEDGLPMVMADATQLRQVVMNLITNASEALGGQDGSITVTVGAMTCDHAYFAQTLLDDELTEGPYAYVEVADTGCGMDEETKARIFDPFFTTKFTGRGLGLAAALGIIRGHQGAIRVDSAPGRGSRIRVLLPVTGESAADAAPKPWELGAVQATILLVDDEEIVRQVSGNMLRAEGFEVLTASDGREGVELFRRHADEIDLVLLDLAMPRMNGNEAFKAIREIRPGVSVVLSSGYGEDEARERFLATGYDDFLKKPYRRTELRAKIHEVLG